MNLDMIKQLISSVFQGSGGTMSKQSILNKVMSMKNGQAALPVFQQLPDRNDYTEQSATQEAQNIVRKQGAGSIAGKVRSKVGI